MEKVVSITGASSGIGKALAFKFASKGYNLLLAARRRKLLESVKQEIEKKFNVSVSTATTDLTDRDSLNDFYEELASLDVYTLVNNSGFGDFSFPWEMDIEKAEQMIDLNMKALAMLSLRFVKDNADKDATLLNISSLGGYYMFDVSVTYCATKFFVSAFTEGLSSSLKTAGKKLRAKLLAPGPTESEFFIRATEKATMDPRKLFGEDFVVISSEQLAEYAYQLFISDSTVGLINLQNELELKQPIFPNMG